MKEFVEKLIGRLEEEKQRLRRLPNDCIALCDREVIEIEEKAYNFCKEIVNQLAEEYNNGWIPCSERLPEANQKVLTCDKDGWISVNVNTPYIGVRNDFECGYYVAWMPLPAPYQKGAGE